MLKKLLAAVATLALGVGISTALSVPGALAATTVPPCVVDVIHHEAVDEVSHQEYRYSKVIPGVDATTHTEYRYRTRTVTYGYIEHKYIYSTWDFVSGGSTTINGHTVSGHWQNLGGSPFWHAIADSAINAVWGSGGIPDSLIGGSQASPHGNVPLSAYGAPGGAGSAAYYATKELNPSGYTDWGPWSAWSTTDPGAANDTRQVETQQVSDGNAIPPTTVYYLPGGSPTSTLTDANWTPETLAEVGVEWTLVDQRKVVDSAAIDAWDENVYGDCVIPPPTVSCLENVVDSTLTLPALPGVLWKVDGAAAVAGPVIVTLTTEDVVIQAVPASGYAFSAGPTTWTLEADENGFCQFPTLAEFPTDAVPSDEVCFFGALVPGSITVGQVGGMSFFTGEVDYFLDGSPTPMASPKVTVAPGLHTVTAAPHDPDDTLIGLTSWSFTIAAVDEVCADIPTLALTGAAAAPWRIAGLLALTGGLGLLAVKRARPERFGSF